MQTCFIFINRCQGNLGSRSSKKYDELCAIGKASARSMLVDCDLGYNKRNLNRLVVWISSQAVNVPRQSVWIKWWQSLPTQTFIGSSQGWVNHGRQTLIQDLSQVTLSTQRIHKKRAIIKSQQLFAICLSWHRFLSNQRPTHPVQLAKVCKILCMLHSRETWAWLKFALDVHQLAVCTSVGKHIGSHKLWSCKANT